MKVDIVVFKKNLLLLVVIVVLFGVFLMSITRFDDPFSTKLRLNTEHEINSYLTKLSRQTAKGSVDAIDEFILHSSALVAIAVTRFQYPEASSLLFHYIYGKGEVLELSPEYFKHSQYLQKKIKTLGNGKHGPLPLRQHEDWRLSLVFNPYYLHITENSIKMYHDNVEFERSSNQLTYTDIPIGKLKIRMHDNIISVLNPTPFPAYSYWER